MARNTGRPAAILLGLAALLCAALSWPALPASSAFTAGASPARAVAPPPAGGAAPEAAAAAEEAPTGIITAACSLLSRALVCVGAAGLLVAAASTVPARAHVGSVGNTGLVVSAAPAWSHNDIPAWTKDYPMCAGSEQSPIDIPTAKADKKNATDSLTKHVTYVPQGGREFVNNTHVMQVNGDFGKFALPDGEYDVKQFHFHFPAEHPVDGKLGAGELHIVHQKKGATGTDGLAVIGVVLEEKEDAAAPESKFLSALGFGTGLPADNDKQAVTEPVDLNSFKDELGGGFYHYQGSLTTPPCAEKVHWYVAKKTAPVTKAMVKTFRDRYPNGDNRPPLAINGRSIVFNDIDIDGEFA